MRAPLLALVPGSVRAGLAFLIAFVLTAALTAITIRVCRKRNWVSRPRPDRWHKGTPAFFGGVPMFAGLVLTNSLLLPASNHFAWMVGISVLVFLLGLFDDIFHLQPLQKLLAQVVIAGLALACGFSAGIAQPGLLNVGVSLLWIVGITNAFNLLDNMDGLCAGTGMITSSFLAAWCLGDGVIDSAALNLVTSGMLAGFLLFNFHPARIFMGDSGSLLVGFLLANSALLQSRAVSREPRSAFAPVILLALPILDTLFVSLTRRLRGQPISQGGTDHTSHRLVGLGMKQRSAVLLLYGVTAVSGGLAISTRFLAYRGAAALTGSWFLLLLLLGVQLFTATRPDSKARGEGFEADTASFSLGRKMLNLIGVADSGEHSR